MRYKFFTVFFLLFCTAAASAQQDSFSKNFRKFQQIAPGVDFFARSRTDVTPFEKPVAEAQQKLAAILGDTLAKGAIVICSTLEQKDSVNETRVLKLGYRWVLIQLTPEASNQQMLAAMKARSGGQLPPGFLERFQNRTPEMKAASETALAAMTARRFANAVTSMTLAPEKGFRSSRLDDMGRSPLADWLDIGLATYASSSANANLRFLQEHLEEAFPLEDVVGMSRPFVAPSEGGAAQGGTFVFRSGGGPAGPPGGATAAPPSARTAPSQPAPGQPAPGMARVGSPAAIPKDIQDRMLFDAQSATLFNFLINKAGVDKAKELVQWNRDGKDVQQFLTRPDVFGPDLEKIEKEWQSWVKSQKPEGPVRILTTPGRAPQSPPQ